MKKGLLFVISAPSGTGKTTLVQMLLKEFHNVVESVSCTTRKRRDNEVEGRDYHFLSKAQFEEKIEEGEFLEYAKVFGHYYGTSHKWVQDCQAKGKHVVLVIDTQGALQLQGKVDAAFIFIKPPSLDALHERLAKRKADSDEAMRERLSWAEKEMALAEKYDYQIVNDRLEKAYDVLKAILIAEEHRNR